MYVELTVDYKDRFIVKKLGAIWKPDIKKWTYSGHNIPFGLLPFIENIQSVTEQAKIDVYKDYSKAEKDRFAILDNNKHSFFDIHHKIAKNMLALLNSDFILTCVQSAGQTTLSAKEINTAVASAITSETINDLITKHVTAAFKCTLKNDLSFLSNDAAFNKVKRLIWVDDKNANKFIAQVDDISKKQNSYIDKASESWLQEMIVSVVKSSTTTKADSLAKQFDFLASFDVSTIDIERFINNDYKAVILGHVISLSDGRKTVDINNTNVLHHNGALALKLYELDSVRQFSRRLIKQINTHTNTLCNTFIASGIKSVSVESGMWVANSRSGHLAKGFTQRGEWFLSAINKTDIKSQSPATSKLVKAVVNAYK